MKTRYWVFATDRWEPTGGFWDHDGVHDDLDVAFDAAVKAAAEHGGAQLIEVTDNAPVSRVALEHPTGAHLRTFDPKPTLADHRFFIRPRPARSNADTAGLDDLADAVAAATAGHVVLTQHDGQELELFV